MLFLSWTNQPYSDLLMFICTHRLRQQSSLIRKTRQASYLFYMPGNEISSRGSQSRLVEIKGIQMVTFLGILLFGISLERFGDCYLVINPITGSRFRIKQNDGHCSGIYLYTWIHFYGLSSEQNGWASSESRFHDIEVQPTKISTKQGIYLASDQSVRYNQFQRMGSDNSKTEPILQDYTIVGQREDPRYGQFKLIDHKGKEFAMVVKTCATYNEYCNFCAKLNGCKQLNNIPDVVKLLAVECKEESQLCSSFYKVTAVYEYFPHTVTNFTLSQLKTLVATLEQIYAAGQSHGSLNSHFILESDEGLKLTNVQALTGFTAYKRSLLEQGDWFLSPEQVLSLQEQNMRPNFDVEKCDVYTLGLTVLENWVGLDIQSIYDKELFLVKETVLEQALDGLADQYGALLKNVIKQMIQIDPRMRPSFQELNQYLSPLNNFSTEQSQQQQIEKSRSQSPIKSRHISIQRSKQLSGQTPIEQSPFTSRNQQSHSPKPLVTISQEHYRFGSISAQLRSQFGYLAEEAQEETLQSDILLERNNNIQSQQAPVQAKPKVVKKSVPAPKSQAHKSISMKRPKADQIESKLPKTAVITSRRR